MHPPDDSSEPEATTPTSPIHAMKRRGSTGSAGDGLDDSVTDQPFPRKPPPRSGSLVDANTASLVRKNVTDGDGGGDAVTADLLGRSVDSFYFRVQASLADPTNTSISLVVDVFVCITCMMVQAIAFNGARAMQILYSQWGCNAYDDDCAAGNRAFPQGPPVPSNIRFMLGPNPSPRFSKLLWYYVPTVIFCVMSLVSQARGEIDESRAGFLLIHHKWKRVLRDRDPAHRRPCYVLSLLFASLISLLRIVVLNAFFNNAVIVLGTSDGIFEMVLNSVALVFILDFDDIITYDLPDQNFFRIASVRQLQRHAARWVDARSIFTETVRIASTRTENLLRLYTVFSSTCSLLIGILIGVSVLQRRPVLKSAGVDATRFDSPRLQLRATSRSKFISAPRAEWDIDDRMVDDGRDDDFRAEINGDQGWTAWLPIYFAVLLLLDHHAMYRFGSHAKMRYQVPIFALELVTAVLAIAVVQLVFGPLSEFQHIRALRVSD